MLDGLIESVEDSAPVFHVYVLAPLADKMVELPTQMVAELTVTLGEEVTITEVVFVCEHPAAFVPLTVYVVLAVGETEMDALVEPVFQE